MLDRKTLQALGCWDGYKLDRVEWPEGESRTLALYLKPVSKIMSCEECGSKCRQVHETWCGACAIFHCSSTGWCYMSRAGGCGAINAVARGSSGSNGWGAISESRPDWRRPAGSCYVAARCRRWRLSTIWVGIPSKRSNDRQDPPARGGRRAGLVQHPLPRDGRVRAAHGSSLCHGGRRSDWAASALDRPGPLARNSARLL